MSFGKLLQHIWDKLFKNGPSKIYRRQPLKNLKGYPYKFFKGCLPQILLDPFLNTLPHPFYIEMWFLKFSEGIFSELLKYFAPVC